MIGWRTYFTLPFVERFSILSPRRFNPRRSSAPSIVDESARRERLKTRGELLLDCTGRAKSRHKRPSLRNLRDEASSAIATRCALRASLTLLNLMADGLCIKFPAPDSARSQNSTSASSRVDWASSTYSAFNLAKLAHSEPCMWSSDSACPAPAKLGTRRTNL